MILVPFTINVYLIILKIQEFKIDISTFFRIKSDHNTDRSIEILKFWISSVKDSYHSIFTEFVDGGANYPEEIGPGHWTSDRLNHIITLRESSLNHARKIWADFYLV